MRNPTLTGRRAAPGPGDGIMPGNGVHGNDTEAVLRKQRHRKLRHSGFAGDCRLGSWVVIDPEIEGEGRQPDLDRDGPGCELLFGIQAYFGCSTSVLRANCRRKSSRLAATCRRYRSASSSDAPSANWSCGNSTTGKSPDWPTCTVSMQYASPNMLLANTTYPRGKSSVPGTESRFSVMAFWTDQIRWPEAGRLFHNSTRPAVASGAFSR
jgi:hypothetical protein